jgi:hypothetical protein
MLRLAKEKGGLIKLTLAVFHITRISTPLARFLIGILLHYKRHFLHENALQLYIIKYIVSLGLEYNVRMCS